MKILRSLALLLAALVSTPLAHSLDGSWRGELEIMQMKLPLVFNFTRGADGSQGCTMDSPNQGAKGIPVDVLLCTNDSLSLSCPAIGATYQGKVEANIINGTFSQRGYSFPLCLSKELSIEERRPQTPRQPHAYESVDTVFRSTDGTLLSGTLVLPRTTSSAKMPAVVLVSGSGPQNRDEELFDHKPIAVIADRLAAKGIASFRYDDRGTAKSGGNFAESTFYDFAADASAALSFVKSLPQTGKTGIIGHSEGGTIAILLASEQKPDFIISLAGMSLPATETLIEQNRHSLEIAGIKGTEFDNSILLVSEMFRQIKEQYKAGKSEPIDIDLIIKEKGLSVPPLVLQSIKANSQTRTRQFDCLLSLEPAAWLAKIRVPLLALNGDMDTQVKSSPNLALIREKVKGAQVKEYPGLNHLFQHCTTGNSDEYFEIRETISEEVLADMADFILSIR